MTQMSLLVALFYFVHTFCFTVQTDSSSFLIYNVEHNKCVTVSTANAVEAEPCDPANDAQQFRWVSERRLLSVAQKLCLGAQSMKDWVKVLLFPCDEKSELQHWECKNETLFGLRGVDLHLNFGNFNEKNMMVYKGSGSYSHWQVYGTQDNLCSHGYQEMFTIGGNGYGAPCQFPFKFSGKWYTNCTADGRKDGLLWCATETDYDEHEKYGFCPRNLTGIWDTDPVTGVLYLRNPHAALTWHQARKSCRQQGADLLSIVELHEQTYISGLLDNFATSLWIGLNSLDSEGGWQWSNGSPFRYLNWAPGHPSSEPGLNCAVLNKARASKWETQACSKKRGYICLKKNSTSLFPLSPASGQLSFCPSPWLQYAGYCYYLQRKKKTWQDALSECHREGGDLASIHNIEEQSFIISQLGYQPSDKLWIGLNDQRNVMLFEWTDRSPVTFTRWQVDEPSHDSSVQEDCVLIQGEEGKWADYLCEMEFGYICKKKASSKPNGTAVVVSPGCKPGWMRFGSYCYYIGSQAKTFDDAKQTCHSSGSYLADVINRYENAFLISTVGLRPEKYFWIGLSNTEDRENFVWTNTKNVKFTHFNIGMPDRKQGCVAMTTGILAGLWDVISCDRKEKYICKHMAEGVVTTLAPPTTQPPSCSPGWTHLGNRNFCYKVYKVPTDSRKTWHEAREFCRVIGGELLSIHDENELDDLTDMVLNRHHFELPSLSFTIFEEEHAWIGINNLNPDTGFVWSDGSPVSYENWDSGEPNNYNGAEFCGEIFLNYRKQWNDRDCDFYNNWICQIQKGITPLPPPNDTQSVYNKTEDGWIVYNGSQYYINKINLPMEEARAYCKKNFGDLVIINEDRERRFLWKQISRGNEGQYYIGMTVDLDKSFQWVDGTPVSYVAWEKNEPNFSNNDETCVSMFRGSGFWNDINCGASLPSICKRSQDVPVNATLAPTVLPEGGCPSDWIHFHGQCYKIFGANHSDLKPWKEARNHCISLGGNLVSISSEQEQTFLTTQMLGMTADMWIGLNDLSARQQFVWTSGKGLRYTNWAKGQPMSLLPRRYYHPKRYIGFSQLFNYRCVVMLTTTAFTTGSWKLENCNLGRGFICKKDIDPKINPPAPTELPKTYQSLGNSSFKLVPQKMNWDEARTQCKADGAELASIIDHIMQSFIMLQLQHYKEPLWIGLNSNVTNGYFHWTDNWRLRYSNWAPEEPKNNLACVIVDVDGKWKTASCNETHYSLCKRSLDAVPTVAPQLPGKCPELALRTSWVPFRGHCYAFIFSRILSWAQASMDCMQMGGVLLSIEDPLEDNFIQENIEMLRDNSRSFWIGLYKTHRGEWLWIDNAAVDYTNWLAGESSSSDNDNCVEVLSESSKWKKSDCDIPMSYICKTSKIIVTDAPTSSPALPSVNELKKSSTGLTVVMVFLILSVVGLIGFLVYKKKQGPVRRECTLDSTLYFDSIPSRPTSDSEGLVANIEDEQGFMI